MVIAVIGAGLSGLTAARELAQAGHQVTVIEKSRGFGGRMATRYAGKDEALKMDHGLSYFTADSPEFRKFVVELLENKLLQVWGDHFALYDGRDFHETSSNAVKITRYTSRDGMNSIGKYLGRWVDVKFETKASGLTYVGNFRGKKRAWMVNLESSGTFEADAIIIALPAAQAYGLLNTTQDETDILKMVSVINEIKYSTSFTVMAGYGKQAQPDWQGIISKDSVLNFISNESYKRGNNDELAIVLNSTPGFAYAYRDADKELVTRQMLDRFAAIAGAWGAVPEWSQIHYWRYSQSLNTIPKPFLELKSGEGPLALIGDYFEGNSVDHAYRSGLKLAQNWISKYAD